MKKKTLTEAQFVKAMAAVKARNKTFQKLSAKNKRIAIANDVISQIKTKALKPKQGVYFESAVVDSHKHGPLDEDGFADPDAYDKLDLRDQLIRTQESCQVCALGSLFACTVKIQNKISVLDGEVAYQDSIIEYLDGIFSAS